MFKTHNCCENSTKTWYEVFEKLEEVQKNQLKSAAHRQSAPADNGPTYVGDLEKFNDNDYSDSSELTIQSNDPVNTYKSNHYSPTLWSAEQINLKYLSCL